MKLIRPHHQAIWEVLQALDGDFLLAHNILFGGGTRIVMELGEYRESVDIDLFCVGRDAYRAARSSVTSSGFGSLFQSGKEPGLYQGREIRADRDAIRCMIEGHGRRALKFEIIHFDNDDIVADPRESLFPVPCVGKESCFTTKLLANADRFRDSHKDLVDLCMMRREWGEMPEKVWQAAFNRYGERVVMRGLQQALELVIQNAGEAVERLVSQMKVEPELADSLVRDTAVTWLGELS